MKNSFQGAKYLNEVLKSIQESASLKASHTIRSAGSKCSSAKSCCLAKHSDDRSV